MYYQVKHGDEMYEFDTDTAVLLLSTRWRDGRERWKWTELYRLQNGKYVVVYRTLEAVPDKVHLTDKLGAAILLGQVQCSQRTDAGDELLREAEK